MTGHLYERLLVAVPVRSFTTGKTRLDGGLTPTERAQLAEAIAGHTVEAAVATGARVAIVTSDAEVVRWAAGADLPVIDDPGGDLDAAARAATRFAAGQGVAWLIMHGDLPLATPAALTPVVAAAAIGAVIVPSYDGGTNLIGGRDPIRFAYGPGSFHSHLRRVPEARVVVDYRLMLDLDTPDDLKVARSLPAGAWLNEI